MRSRKLLYAIEPVGRSRYAIRWLDDGVPHVEVWVGSLLALTPRLVELGLVMP